MKGVHNSAVNCGYSQNILIIQKFFTRENKISCGENILIEKIFFNISFLYTTI